MLLKVGLNVSLNGDELELKAWLRKFKWKEVWFQRGLKADSIADGVKQGLTEVWLVETWLRAQEPANPSNGVESGLEVLKNRKEMQTC